MRTSDKEQELIAKDIHGYLTKHQNKELLRFVTVGSVDDGKSTLIGRLLYDSHMIYEDQLDKVAKDSKVFGTTDDGFDPALLTDGLKAEREQGITIDVAYRYFSTDKRKFIIADTPGHEQYTRNMATGASTADLSIILIDARPERVGPRPVTSLQITQILDSRQLTDGILVLEIRGAFGHETPKLRLDRRRLLASGGLDRRRGLGGRRRAPATSARTVPPPPTPGSSRARTPPADWRFRRHQNHSGPESETSLRLTRDGRAEWRLMRLYRHG